MCNFFTTDFRTYLVAADQMDAGEFEVERIVSCRTVHGKRQYLVHWKGYSENDDTWEAESGLNCDRLLAQFWSETQQQKPKPPLDLSKIRIDGVCLYNGAIAYHISFDNKTRSTVTSDYLRTYYPQELLDYLVAAM